MLALPTLQAGVCFSAGFGLTLLPAGHLVALLPPYHRSFGKRLVKTPQCDNHGLEVELVFEYGQPLQALDCKSGVIYAAAWLGPARRWCDAAGVETVPPILVDGGDRSHQPAGHQVMSWRDLGVAA